MRFLPGYQGPLLAGLTLAPGFGGPSNPMPRPGSLGGNNGGGLATTVNSLPPQIESLSSALQNINELANQLTGGIGALMGSLGGNENASTLGNQMPMRPPTASINHAGLGGGLLPYRPNRPAIGGGVNSLLGTNILFSPLQQAGGQM